MNNSAPYVNALQILAEDNFPAASLEKIEKDFLLRKDELFAYDDVFQIYDPKTRLTMYLPCPPSNDFATRAGNRWTLVPHRLSVDGLNYFDPQNPNIMSTTVSPSDDQLTKAIFDCSIHSQYYGFSRAFIDSVSRELIIPPLTDLDRCYNQLSQDERQSTFMTTLQALYKQVCMIIVRHVIVSLRPDLGDTHRSNTMIPAQKFPETILEYYQQLEYHFQTIRQFQSESIYLKCLDIFTGTDGKFLKHIVAGDDINKSQIALHSINADPAIGLSHAAIITRVKGIRNDNASLSDLEALKLSLVALDKQQKVIMTYRESLTNSLMSDVSTLGNDQIPSSEYSQFRIFLTNLTFPRLKETYETITQQLNSQQFDIRAFLRPEGGISFESERTKGANGKRKREPGHELNYLTASPEVNSYKTQTSFQQFGSLDEALITSRGSHIADGSYLGPHGSNCISLASIDVDLLNRPACFESLYDTDPEIFSIVSKGLALTVSPKDLDNHEKLSQEVCFKFLNGKCPGQCSRKHLSKEDIVKIVSNALSRGKGPFPFIPFRPLTAIVGIEQAKRYLAMQKTLYLKGLNVQQGESFRPSTQPSNWNTQSLPTHKFPVQSSARHPFNPSMAEEPSFSPAKSSSEPKPFAFSALPSNLLTGQQSKDFPHAPASNTHSRTATANSHFFSLEDFGIFSIELDFTEYNTTPSITSVGQSSQSSLQKLLQYEDSETAFTERAIISDHSDSDTVYINQPANSAKPVCMLLNTLASPAPTVFGTALLDSGAEGLATIARISTFLRGEGQHSVLYAVPLSQFGAISVRGLGGSTPLLALAYIQISTYVSLSSQSVPMIATTAINAFLTDFHGHSDVIISHNTLGTLGFILVPPSVTDPSRTQGHQARLAGFRIRAQAMHPVLRANIMNRLQDGSLSDVDRQQATKALHFQPWIDRPNNR